LLLEGSYGTQKYSTRENYRHFFVLKLVVRTIPHTNKLCGNNRVPGIKPDGIYIYIVTTKL